MVTHALFVSLYYIGSRIAIIAYPSGQDNFHNMHVGTVYKQQRNASYTGSSERAHVNAFKSSRPWSSICFVLTNVDHQLYLSKNHNASNKQCAVPQIIDRYSVGKPKPWPRKHIQGYDPARQPWVTNTDGAIANINTEQKRMQPMGLQHKSLHQEQKGVI